MCTYAPHRRVSHAGTWEVFPQHDQCSREGRVLPPGNLTTKATLSVTFPPSPVILLKQIQHHYQSNKDNGSCFLYSLHYC